MYPKSHFVFQINWKAKFKILYLDIVFTSIRKTKFKNCLPFSCLIDFYFEFLMPSFFLNFHKNLENEIQFLFLFTKELKNELLKQIKIHKMNDHVTSMVYTLFKSKFMSSPLRFSAVQWSCGHQESAVYKTTDTF